jgi:hypothetical protein
LHIGQHLLSQCAELGATVVDGGRTDGPQDAIGHGRRAWNLQEVATRGVKIRGEHAQQSLSVFLAIFCIQNFFVKGVCPKIGRYDSFFCIQKILWALTNLLFFAPFCTRKWRSACARCWWRA